MGFVALLTAAVAVLGTTVTAAQPRALIYRGPASCKGCSEAVAGLLQTSSLNFTITYAGPNESVAVNAESLSKAEVYAQPGGPDLKSAYAELKDQQSAIRAFVDNGGRYMGFCLGAYLAGSTPGLGLLPTGANAVSERKQNNAQVTSSKDTMIQVDWTYRSAVGGHARGETAKNQWVYFQDGAAMTGLPTSNSNETVLGRYSQSQDVAASVTPLGKGWVVLVGPHPEATEEWFRSYRLTNPDGVNFNIGYDFVNTAMTGWPVKSSSKESGVGSASQRGRMMLQNPVGWVIRQLWSVWWL